MRTFKFLLPIISNLVFSIMFYIIVDKYLEDELGYDIVETIDGKFDFSYGSGFFSMTVLAVLFAVTVTWIVINAKKYLSWDLNIRYMLLGIGMIAIIDGLWAIYYYKVYLVGLKYWIMNIVGDIIAQFIRLIM